MFRDARDTGVTPFYRVVYRRRWQPHSPTTAGNMTPFSVTLRCWALLATAHTAELGGGRRYGILRSNLTETTPVAASITRRQTMTCCSRLCLRGWVVIL